MESGRYTLRGISQEGVSDKTIKLAQYGFRNIGFQLVMCLTLMAAAKFFGRVPEMVGFLAVFLTLRLSLPGSHAKSRTACFLKSVAITGIVLGAGIAGEGLIPEEIVLTLMLGTLSVLAVLHASGRRNGRIEKKYRAIGIGAAFLATLWIAWQMPAGLLTGFLCLAWVSTDFLRTMAGEMKRKNRIERSVGN